jgi:hypothetical protein
VRPHIAKIIKAVIFPHQPRIVLGITVPLTLLGRADEVIE